MIILDKVKKYWFLYTLLGGAAVWLATINSKTFDSAEQKVNHITFIKNSLSPFQQQIRHFRDSIDKESRVKSRRFRDSLNLERYKIEKIKEKRDSANAVTLYQLKEEFRDFRTNN